jgi:hypothetical protein
LGCSRIASTSWQIIRSTDGLGVGVGGVTGSVLEHNLARMRDLLDRSVSENTAATQLKQFQ